jgi:FkbM family methyltransferase
MERWGTIGRVPSTPINVLNDSSEFEPAWWKTMLVSALPMDAEPTGIIYAGAHVGEHLRLFRACGFRAILAVEPNAEAFRALEAEAANVDGVRCVKAALGVRDGVCDYFDVSGIPTLNSTLEPVRDFWIELAGQEMVDQHPVRRLEVPCARLDTLVAAGRDEFNALYLNTQGAELEVLGGASRVLGRVEAVFTEVNFARRYSGCALFEDLNQCLQEHGFGLVYLWRYRDGGYAHGEALYSRALGRSASDSRVSARR